MRQQIIRQRANALFNPSFALIQSDATRQIQIQIQVKQIQIQVKSNTNTSQTNTNELFAEQILPVPFPFEV